MSLESPLPPPLLEEPIVGKLKFGSLSEMVGNFMLFNIPDNPLKLKLKLKLKRLSPFRFRPPIEVGFEDEPKPDPEPVEEPVPLPLPNPEEPVVFTFSTCTFESEEIKSHDTRNIKMKKIMADLFLFIISYLNEIYNAIALGASIW
ncbi:hypothetical protein [Caldiplasma sukawensis]